MLYDFGHTWRDVSVVNTDNGEIKLRYKGYRSNWDKVSPRNKFLIREDVLSALGKPEAAENYA